MPYMYFRLREAVEACAPHLLNLVVIICRGLTRLALVMFSCRLSHIDSIDDGFPVNLITGMTGFIAFTTAVWPFRMAVPIGISLVPKQAFANPHVTVQRDKQTRPETKKCLDF
jgi:hypothetical protein